MDGYQRTTLSCIVQHYECDMTVTMRVIGMDIRADTHGE